MYALFARVVCTVEGQSLHEVSNWWGMCARYGSGEMRYILQWSDHDHWCDRNRGGSLPGKGHFGRFVVAGFYIVYLRLIVIYVLNCTCTVHTKYRKGGLKCAWRLLFVGQCMFMIESISQHSTTHYHHYYYSCNYYYGPAIPSRFPSSFSLAFFRTIYSMESDSLIPSRASISGNHKSTFSCL